MVSTNNNRKNDYSVYQSIEVYLKTLVRREEIKHSFIGVR